MLGRLVRLLALLRAPRPTLAVYRTADRVLAAYKARHDVHDLATLPCIYGCQDPVTCVFPHVRCDHCRAAREAAAGA